MKKPLDDILISRNLNTVQRYSLVRTNKSQSVAEHSFGVGVLTHLIFRDLEDYFEKWFSERLKENLLTEDEFLGLMNSSELYLMLSSMYHDFGEAVTGDIIYPFKNSKYFSNEGERCYISEVFNETLFKRHLPLLLDFSHDNIDERISYFNSYLTKGAKDKIGVTLMLEFVCCLDSIIKYCDALELFIYTMEEIQSGNSLIRNIHDAGIQILSNEKFKFINENSKVSKQIVRDGYQS